MLLLLCSGSVGCVYPNSSLSPLICSHVGSGRCPGRAAASSSGSTRPHRGCWDASAHTAAHAAPGNKDEAAGLPMRRRRLGWGFLWRPQAVIPECNLRHRGGGKKTQSGLLGGWGVVGGLDEPEFGKVPNMFAAADLWSGALWVVNGLHKDSSAHRQELTGL